MATRLDPLEYLERDDKWYLGGGRGAMFAPTFPRYLDSFGFWDEAYFADVRLERLYTVLVLGENERPLKLRRDGGRWTPDALTQTFTTSDGLRIREDKVLTARDTLASRLTVFNEGRRSRSLHFVLWSLQSREELRPGIRATSAEEARRSGDYVSFAHTVEYGQTPFADGPAEAMGWGEHGIPPSRPERHALYVALGADRAPISYTACLAEPADTAPLWDVSVVSEKLHDGRLDDQFRPDAGTDHHGHLHICLHYTVEIPAGESRAIQFGAALNLNRDRALHFLQNDLQQDVAAVSREAWQAYFGSVPYFECSDEYLQTYYWYRWYGLRMLTVDLTDEEQDRFPNPCVFEGIGGFRCHISYSAQCHMLDAGWMHDPTLAFGSLEGMLASQENSGFIPGHIYLWREERGFYHANWGANALQLYHITGDRSFVERVYPGLSRYADYFERERDREDSHLYDIVDQGETGQEYMSRYLFVDRSADDWRRIQLKGVDATVYIYLLQRALAEMAGVLGKHPEAEVWERKADATRDSVRAKMWDPDRRFYFDLDPRSGERSPYAAAVGFYPFLCDIALPGHLSALTDHLLNPGEFWTTWPVPASPIDDPFFSAEAEWKGKRMSCPWNGRVWPMTNSHVCEAIARAALTLDDSLKPQAARLIERFIRMMFYDGDPERPNCFEHYNPFTGAPCAYRGVDDYQHSWVNDLLLKYLIGIQPNGSDTLVLDPLPFDVERFAIEDIRYRGHRVDVSWDTRGGFVVVLDGVERARSPHRQRIEIPLTT